MSTVRPFLWFDHQAAEAAHFYVSVFPNARIVAESEGYVEFAIDDRTFIAFDGGPENANFTPAISFFVTCETQAEIDALWEPLRTGGNEMRCGWVTDRFGVTWQIVPSILGDLICGDDASAARARDAMLGMVKFDIAALKAAAKAR